MIWPGWYLCLYTVLAIVVSGLDTKYARVMLLLALIAQCADLSTAAAHSRNSIKKSAARVTQLASPQWALFDQRYHHFVFIRPAQLSAYLVGWSPDYRMLALQSVRHGLSVNIGYLSRLNETELNVAETRRKALLLGGQAESSTFYVIDDSELWRKILCIPDQGQWHGMLEGMQVLVPDPSPDLHLPPPSVDHACSE